MTFKQALCWTSFWITCAIAFNGYIYHTMGAVAAAEFGHAYLMEKLLSFDNLFVFLLIFEYFGIGGKDQRGILNVGIAWAFILRAICIFSGVALIAHLHWLLYGFGALLVYSGYKVFYSDDEDDDIGESRIVKFCQRFHANKFIICLIAIELSDIVFATDSIPAVLAITDNSFIAYTSNIFAILGLRSLYFVMTGIEGLMKKMTTGIGLVLLFIGIKMLLVDFVSIPPLLSLGITCAILLTNLIIIFITRKES